MPPTMMWLFMAGLLRGGIRGDRGEVDIVKLLTDGKAINLQSLIGFSYLFHRKALSCRVVN